MHKILFSVWIFLFAASAILGQEYALVLHGGAGDGITPENFDPAKKQLYEAKMNEALRAGEAVLQSGGSAVDAVETVILILEDSPLFNAGKGAVLTWEGDASLDASIMDGKDLSAGAISGASAIRNPITAARLVMDSSIHVMLSGAGADEYARLHKLSMADQDYFKTEDRMKSLEKYKDRMGAVEPNTEWDYSKLGTVGCVAIDKEGHIAAGTSTGGMTGKRYGRIGDSPIIGAGTYASDSTCGISCTGHGEYFIRYAVAHDLHARILYGQEDLQEAADQLIMKELLQVGGKGGIIGIDRNGKIVMVFNTKGMFRGYIREGEEPVVLMF